MAILACIAAWLGFAGTLGTMSIAIVLCASIDTVGSWLVVSLSIVSVLASMLFALFVTARLVFRSALVVEGV